MLYKLKLFVLVMVVFVAGLLQSFKIAPVGWSTNQQALSKSYSNKPLQMNMTSEFIFDTAPFASCHASTIVELNDGSLMAAWFGGTAEGESDVAIWGSRRIGGKWNLPIELVREAGTPCWNPVLFYTADGKLWLYYKFGPRPDSWSAGRMWSNDHGVTWSKAEHLPAGLYGPIRAKPLLLTDGTIVSGSSVESYRNWAVWIERSRNNGKSWDKIGPITLPSNLYGTSKPNDVPKEVPGSAEWQYTEGIIQPSVISLGGRHLRLYARSTAKVGKVCVADSWDSGLTWTQARPIELPNPNSGLDAVQLRDGRVILIYNHTTSGRTPLNLAVSQDGEHFQPFYTLEKEPGEFSYPNIIQGRNGSLHLSYTWNRKRIRYVHFSLSDVP